MRPRLRLLFGREVSRLRRWPWLHAEVRQRHLRRLAMAVPVADDVLLCRMLGHFKLYVAAHDTDITPHLALDGYWEPDVTEVVIDRLKLGDTAIDVGANVGYFTLLMAGLVGHRGRVLSFEAAPAPAALLARSLRANGFLHMVDLHVLPVAESDGQRVALVTPENASGGGHIVGTDRPDGTAVALTRRLDGVPGALDAVLVKLDTEGSEERIWAGMTAMLAGGRLRYVVIEFSRFAYADPARLLAEASAAGFRFRRIGARGLLPETNATDILAGPPLQMLLFER